MPPTSKSRNSRRNIYDDLHDQAFATAGKWIGAKYGIPYIGYYAGLGLGKLKSNWEQHSPWEGSQDGDLSRLEAKAGKRPRQFPIPPFKITEKTSMEPPAKVPKVIEPPIVPETAQQAMADVDMDGGDQGAEGGGDGSGGMRYQLQDGYDGFKTESATYSKTFYQMFPNRNDTLTNVLEPHFTTGTNTKAHFNYCETHWFNLPIQCLCMYMDPWQLEKQAESSCGWKITGGQVTLTDFTILNDKESTQGGAPVHLIIPTTQPYFFIAEDIEHRLPYKAEPCNVNGRIPFCNTRTQGILKPVKFTINRPGTWNNDDMKRLIEPIMRPDVKVSTYHCTDSMYHISWKYNMKWQMLTPDRSTHPFFTPLNPRDPQEDAAMEMQRGDSDWPGFSSTKATWENIRLNTYPTCNTGISKRVHGFNTDIFTTTDSNVNKMMNRNLGRGGWKLCNHLPRVLLRGAPYQDADGKLHKLMYSFIAQYTIFVEYLKTPDHWPSVHTMKHVPLQMEVFNGSGMEETGTA